MFFAERCTPHRLSCPTGFGVRVAIDEAGLRARIVKRGGAPKASKLGALVPQVAHQLFLAAWAYAQATPLADGYVHTGRERVLAPKVLGRGLVDGARVSVVSTIEELVQLGSGTLGRKHRPKHQCQALMACLRESL